MPGVRTEPNYSWDYKYGNLTVKYEGVSKLR
jgi:hypothetical protein